MRIKVEPFLMKKGNRVAKAAIEFESADGILAGFHLVGFTICDDAEKGLFVLFPAVNTNDKVGEKRTFFFLRPSGDDQISKLEELILDVYESMIPKPFNGISIKDGQVTTK
jgi:hypothetical protein